MLRSLIYRTPLLSSEVTTAFEVKTSIESFHQLFFSEAFFTEFFHPNRLVKNRSQYYPALKNLLSQYDNHPKEFKRLIHLRDNNQRNVLEALIEARGYDILELMLKQLDRDDARELLPNAEFNFLFENDDYWRDRDRPWAAEYRATIFNKFDEITRTAYIELLKTSMDNWKESFWIETHITHHQFQRSLSTPVEYSHFGLDRVRTSTFSAEEWAQILNQTLEPNDSQLKTAVVTTPVTSGLITQFLRERDIMLNATIMHTLAQNLSDKDEAESLVDKAPNARRSASGAVAGSAADAVGDEPPAPSYKQIEEDYARLQTNTASLPTPAEPPPSYGDDQVQMTTNNATPSSYISTETLAAENERLRLLLATTLNERNDALKLAAQSQHLCAAAIAERDQALARMTELSAQAALAENPSTVSQQTSETRTTAVLPEQAQSRRSPQFFQPMGDEREKNKTGDASEPNDHDPDQAAMEARLAALLQGINDIGNLGPVAAASPETTATPTVQNEGTGATTTGKTPGKNRVAMLG